MFTLGRKIDMNYATNKIIVIITLLIAVLGFISSRNIFSSLSIAMGVFLSWALAREIDPRHEYSAFLAAAFSSLNLFYYKSISLLVVFWILIMIRTINGITGKELTAFDIFSLLGLSVYLSFNNRNGIYLVIFIILMSSLMVFNERAKISFLAAAVALGFFIVEIFFLKYLFFNRIDYLDRVNLITMALVLAFILLSKFISGEEILDDVGNRAKKFKIFSGQILFSTIVILLLLFGQVGLNNLIIYLSALAGVIIYFILYKTLNLKENK